MLGSAEWLLGWRPFLHISKVKSPDPYLNDQKCNEIHANAHWLLNSAFSSYNHFQGATWKRVWQTLQRIIPTLSQLTALPEAISFCKVQIPTRGVIGEMINKSPHGCTDKTNLISFPGSPWTSPGFIVSYTNLPTWYFHLDISILTVPNHFSLSPFVNLLLLQSPSCQ